jgi:hypothetical protein
MCPLASQQKWCYESSVSSLLLWNSESVGEHKPSSLVPKKDIFNEVYNQIFRRLMQHSSFEVVAEGRGGSW